VKFLSVLSAGVWECAGFIGVRNRGLGDRHRCTLASVCEWVRIDPRGLGDKLYLGVRM